MTKILLLSDTLRHAQGPNVEKGILIVSSIKPEG